MTLGESLRYWLAYRLMMWVSRTAAEVAIRNAPPGDAPPRPKLHLTPPPSDAPPPGQMELTWT